MNKHTDSIQIKRDDDRGGYYIETFDGENLFSDFFVNDSINEECTRELVVRVAVTMVKDLLANT